MTKLSERPSPTTSLLQKMSESRVLLPLLALLSFSIGICEAPAGEPSALVGNDVPGSFALRGQLAVQHSSLRGSEILLAIHHKGASPYLELSIQPDRAVLSEANGSARQELARGSLPELRPNTPFNLFRDDSRLVLTVGGRQVLTGHESTVSGGRIGVRQIGKGLSIASGSFQPRDEIYFTDDFTRAEGHQGEWETLSGEFALHEIKASKYSQQVYSANAFRWGSVSEVRSLAATGHWFWQNYYFAVSVRPTGTGTAGICAWFQDEQNYIAFRCESGKAQARSRLVRVRDGKTTVLAEGDRHLETNQWYRLDIRAVEGNVQARIDGEAACTADLEDWQCGGIGLLAEGDSVQFDDVSVVSTDGFHSSSPAQLASREVPLLPLPKASLLALGSAAWEDATCQLAMAPGTSPDFLVLYGLASPDSYGMLQVHRSPAGAFAKLARVNGKALRALGSAGLPRQFSKLELEIQGQTVSVRLDGRPLAAVYDPGPTSGPMGLAWERGKALPLNRVDVSLPTELYPSPHVNSQFASEGTMQDWSSSSASWTKDANGVYWHESPLYGDFEAVLPNLKLLGANDQWEMTLAESREADGARLSLKADAAKSQYELSLSIKGKPVAKGAVPFSDARAGAALVFCRTSNCLAVRVGEKPVLHAATVARPWSEFGYRPVQTLIYASRLQVRASQTLDDTFSSAPVKWWAERGDWDVRPRWPCDDRWSFLGGINSESPVLWSKPAYHGDLVVDAWLALYMDNVDEPSIGYKHISDLNVTIGGDGRNLSSGYSFQFAAKHNTVSQIRRQQSVVAETTNVVMVNPRRVNVPWQRHWYHLRIEKKKGHLKFYVDGHPALEFNDPKPLPGGHLGLWTWRGGLMVARVRIAGERVSFPERKAAPQFAPGDFGSSWDVTRKPVSVRCSFDRGIRGWTTDADEPGTQLAFLASGNRRYLHAINNISGGPFAVIAGVKPFDVAKFPVLAFDFRADPGTAVNLNLRVENRRLVIPLTAGDEEPNHLNLLPPAQVKADGAWHHLTYKLLEVLKARFPHIPAFTVQKLDFGAPFAEYLRSGFGGNHFGCTYSIDNFELTGARGTDEADAEPLLPQDQSP